MTQKVEGRINSLHDIPLEGEYLERIEWEIKNGKDPDERDENGESLLMKAASFGYLNLAKLMLKCGARIETKDFKGYSPFDFARNSTKNSVEMVELLKNHSDKSMEENSNLNLSVHEESSNRSKSTSKLRIHIPHFHMIHGHSNRNIKGENGNNNNNHNSNARSNADSLNRQGNQFFQSGKFEQAIETYTKALERHGDNCELFANRSGAHLMNGNAVMAKLDAIKSLGMDSDYLPAIVRAVQSSERLGDVEEAKKWIRHGLELDPNESQLLEISERFREKGIFIEIHPRVTDNREGNRNHKKEKHKKMELNGFLSTEPPRMEERLNRSNSRNKPSKDIQMFEGSFRSSSMTDIPVHENDQNHSVSFSAGEKEKKKKFFTFSRILKRKKEHNTKDSSDSDLNWDFRIDLDDSNDSNDRELPSISPSHILDHDPSPSSSPRNKTRSSSLPERMKESNESPNSSENSNNDPLLASSNSENSEGKEGKLSTSEGSEDPDKLVDCVHFDSAKFWLPALKLNDRKPSLPIVLCHGLMGFNKLGPFPYWLGIKQDLERQGCKVVVMRVPPTGSIETRAKHLLRSLEKIIAQMKRENEGGEEYDSTTNTDYLMKSERLGGGGLPNPTKSESREEITSTKPRKCLNKVHIIGHSMAGLDCRYLISMLGGHKWIQSLTTLATPHHGSSVADRFTTTIGVESLLKLVKNIGIPTEAFYQLSPKWIETEFNPYVVDHPDVMYFSMSGGGGKHPVGSLSLMRVYYKYLKKVEGPNDGLVSIGSSKWGEFLGALELDHMDIINWNPRRNTRYIYRNICYLLATKEKELGIQ